MKRPPSLEKASMSILLSLLPLLFAPPFSFSCISIFPYLIFSIFSGFVEISFSNKSRDRFIFGLVIPRPAHSYPQSSVRLSSDSDVATTHSIVRDFLAWIYFPYLLARMMLSMQLWWCCHQLPNYLNPRYSFQRP